MFVQDCAGAHLGTLNSNGLFLLRMAAKLASDNYPETLGAYIIMNAPGFFPLLWAVVKGFIDEKTRNKIKVFSQADQLKGLL